MKKIVILQDNISSEGGYKAGYLLNKLLNNKNITSQIITLDKNFNFLQKVFFHMLKKIVYIRL